VRRLRLGASRAETLCALGANASVRPLNFTVRRHKVVSPRDLNAGSAYYRLTYADPDRTIPGVQPMIYVGSNIFPDDDPAAVTYYFQDTVSHFQRGPVTDAAHDSRHPEIEAVVFTHTEREVQRDVFTLVEVVAALTEAQKRAAGSVGDSLGCAF
jgi:hypothetical protein